MKQEDRTNIEMVLRDVMGNIVNGDQRLLEHRSIGVRRQHGDFSFSYQRRDFELKGIQEISYDGRKMAEVQVYPHLAVKVFNFYDNHSIYIQRMLENILKKYYPKARVEVLDA